VCGYTNGRFAEIIGKNKIEFQLICDAENFIEKAEKYGLQVVNYPTLGGIMVWRKGDISSRADGAGHVAIVERIDSANQIYTSESAYNGSAFYNATRTNNNGRWGMGSAYAFRGCIVNPAIGDVHYSERTPEPSNVTTYTVQAGDTLSEIAVKFGTTVDNLVALNNIENPDLIRTGQVLKINGSDTNVGSITYTVKTGDNLSKIASKYGTTWEAIYEKNKDIIGDDPDIIQPGQILKI